MPKKFKKPIYVTRPILPNLSDLNKILKEVWKSKQLTNNGEQQRKLEKEIGRGHKYVSLVNNGTTALMVACKALELKGEVITTPFTFAATPHALSWIGLKPVFCDIDDSLNIDADKIESLITPRTSAILAVYVYGNLCDVSKIKRIARKHKLKVIYDAAHAFGAKNHGDVTAYSFHATKTFHTIEGGALVVDSLKLKKKIDLLKNFGIKEEEPITMPGINGKMNEVQAAVGRLVLKMIREEIRKRRKLMRIYEKNLPILKNDYQYVVIRTKKRDELCERLKKYNIYARKYFYPLCSDFECYGGKFPVAERASKEVLCLPIYGELKPSEVEKICEITNEELANLHQRR